MVYLPIGWSTGLDIRHSFYHSNIVLVENTSRFSRSPLNLSSPAATLQWAHSAASRADNSPRRTGDGHWQTAQNAGQEVTNQPTVSLFGRRSGRMSTVTGSLVQQPTVLWSLPQRTEPSVQGGLVPTAAGTNEHVTLRRRPQTRAEERRVRLHSCH